MKQTPKQPRQPGLPNTPAPMVPLAAYSGDGWIDGIELRELLKVSARTLHRWRQMGLRYSKPGNRIFYLKSSVDAFLLSYEVKPPKQPKKG